MSVLEPRARNRGLLSILLAGLIGEVAFEFYAWVISPLLFGVALQPSNLVIAMTAKLTGVQISHAVAFPAHFMIGSLGFGAFVYLVRLVMPARVWRTGFVAGLVLWFVAQGLLAPFIGRSFMMGFGSYTQSSFIGHVGMTLLMAHLLAAFLKGTSGAKGALVGASATSAEDGSART
ncbi:hypothetical protein [Antarcticimicrobium sediminis]|uniref:hypothetical protein n=1 Tax=Antarcticimicrobium sediminis TaxID=2546227 RepID=UPI001FDF37AA|nr:hypothetical protein [Antarcticimicrobium sediminis]